MELCPQPANQATLPRGFERWLDGRSIVGGLRVDAVDGAVRPVLDPATGRPFAEVAEGFAADASRAVAAAATAAPAWRATTGRQRQDLLLKLASAIEANADELALLETLDQGQPLWASGGVTVPDAAACLRYYAGWATKLHGVTSGTSIPDVEFRTIRNPVGVCALIVPWNFPLTIAVWKLAPALAAGNTVVLKPSEDTPLSALALGALAQEVGFPDGVVNVVTGGRELGEALVAHPGVAKVSFTGSTAVGREIGAVAGRLLKRVSLELGGKTAAVIGADADVARAAAAVVGGGLYNSGQTCAAFSRMYVHRRRHSEFVDAVVALAAERVPGAGREPGTNLGPLTSARHRDRVVAFIEAGGASGAQLVGGSVPAVGDGGYFVAPVVFADVADEAVIATEEIFGPVLSILEPFDDGDDIAARVNGSPYGLASGVFSQDLTWATKLARSIDSGSVWINPAFPLLDPEAPWGGVKASGVGREMGWAAIEAYTEIKSLWTALD
jgi:acyl-CoA reductase-like NAD-dependent aldehyde dehydrogenase